MKLRIKGNSLRLPVSQSELARLLKVGHIEETIEFAPNPDARLTYALSVRDGAEDIALEYSNRAVTIVLSSASARRWAENDEVIGVYGGGAVALLVEKDFACLDREDAENADTFPNPKAGMVC